MLRHSWQGAQIDVNRLLILTLVIRFDWSSVLEGWRHNVLVETDSLNAAVYLGAW